MSRQAIVGSYLLEHHRSHPITRSVKKLRDSNAWRQMRIYRDEWVHNKPPIIEGLGIDYSRRNRLIVSDDSIGVSFGGGDKPQLSADQLIAIMQQSLNQLSEVVADTLEFYLRLLSQNQVVSF